MMARITPGTMSKVKPTINASTIRTVSASKGRIIEMPVAMLCPMLACSPSAWAMVVRTNAPWTNMLQARLTTIAPKEAVNVAMTEPIAPASATMAA